MLDYLDKVYRRVTKPLPPRLAARFDQMRSWSGSLNEQERRRDILRELASAIHFDRVIETGTYRGASTEFFSEVFRCPVHTVERNPRFYTYSKRRLSVLPNVTVSPADSRAFLRDLSGRQGAAGTVLIYLDAHWGEDLPLAEELQIVVRAWPRAVVIIDDFEVPGEPGYKFDDYGEGKTLTEHYLPADHLNAWTLWYPSASANEETGQKRGCGVLSSHSSTNELSFVESLKFGRTF